MSTSKTFIGHGTTNQKFDTITDVVLKMEDAEQFIFEYEGKKYLKLQVAQRKSPDNFGHTHTVSCFTPEAKPKKGKKK